MLGVSFLDVSYRNAVDPTGDRILLGFRVASHPEPDTSLPARLASRASPRASGAPGRTSDLWLLNWISSGLI